MTILHNKFKQYGIYALMLGSLAACKKSEFAELNTDPTKLVTVAPEGQFLDGIVQMNSGDYEVYYDFYRTILPFTEMIVNNGGNGQTFMADNVGNANNRYGYYYTRIGNDFTNVVQLINAMSPEQKAAHTYEKAIAQIPNIYYAWYVSDINGSIPYSEAFQGRYTGNFTPKYDTQAELYALWDTQLKGIVDTLKQTLSAQASYGNNDLYYKGDVSKWLKAANSLRLKIASRLSKVDNAKFHAIALEVLADEANTFQSIDDDLVLVAGNTFTGGGNWNPVGFHASKSMVDFMLANNDPRLRVFYSKNSYSKPNFDSAVSQGVLPPTSTFNANQYVGAYSSPDAITAFPGYFRIRKIKGSTGADVSLDSSSLIQYRLWQAEYTYGDSKGLGFTTLPLLTYADICFLRAELALDGVGTDAQGWYYKGVEASIRRYNKMADAAKLPDFVAVSDDEIATYKNSPGVKYDAANALPLIASQAFVNYFKTPNEAWAILKRLGMPNATTPLALEVVKSSGVTQLIPRRASLNILPETDRNQANNKAALAEMATNPDFGNGPSDVSGRVWWDKK
jgi:hypothetical protein